MTNLLYFLTHSYYLFYYLIESFYDLFHFGVEEKKILFLHTKMN